MKIRFEEALFRSVTKVLLTCVLLVFSFNCGHGQVIPQSRTDSLKSIVDHDKTSASQKADIYIQLCWEFRNSDFEAALEYGQRAVEESIKAGDVVMESKANNIVGVIYRNMGNHAQAMNQYFLALKIAEENNITNQIGYSFNNIGDLYRVLGDYDLAIENIMKGARYFVQDGDREGEAYALIRVAEVYENKGDLAQALVNIDASLKIRYELNNPDVIASSLNTKGSIYLRLGQYGDAIESLEKSLVLSVASKNDKRIAEIYSRLGKGYLGLSSWREAISNSENAYKLAKALDIKEYMVEALGTMAKAYEALGDYQIANELFKDRDSVRNEMFHTYGNQQIYSLQASFDLLKRQQELEMEKADREWQNTVFVVGAVILILLIIIVATLLWHQKHQHKLNTLLSISNDEIQNKNEELVATSDELLSHVARLESMQVVLSQAESKTLYKSKLLEAVSKGQTILSEHHHWMDALKTCLPLLGGSMNMDRTYFFQNHLDESTGTYHSSQQLEWTKEGISSQMDNTALQNVNFNVECLEMFGLLKRGEVYNATLSNLPLSSTKQGLEAKDIKTILVFPIFVEEIFYGYIGFDDCTTEREVSEDERNIIYSFADSLGRTILLQKQREELKAYTTKLKGILDSTSDSNVLISLDCKLLNFNLVAEQNIAANFGVKPRIGDDFNQYILEIFSDSFHQGFESAKNGVVVKKESSVAVPGLGEKWFDFQFYPVYGHQGSIIAVSFNVVDISDRKIAEEKPKLSQDQTSGLNRLLNAILESPQGMVVFALDTAFCYVAFTQVHKKIMQQIWGVDIEIGKCMLDYIDNIGDVEKAKSNFKRALAGESFVLEEEYGDKNLYRTFYEDRYNPLMDESGNILGLTVFVTEITERKLYELNLKQSEERAIKQKDAIAKLTLNEAISNADLERSFDIITTSLAEALQVERASIWIFNDDRTSMMCASYFDKSNDSRMRGIQLKYSDYPLYFFTLINEYSIISIDAMNDPKIREFAASYLATFSIGALIDVAVKESGKIVGVVCLEHVGGTRVWKNDESSFVTAIANLIGQLIANNKRIVAETALKESEDYHRTLIKTIPDLIFVLNKQGRFIYYKADILDKQSSFENILGKSIDEVLPASVADLLNGAIQKALATKEVVEYQYSLEVDKQLKSYNGRVMALLNDNVMCLEMDTTDSVTNLKRIESLLITKEEQNKRLQNFTHIVSHNLRSHVANMQGLLEVMRLEDPSVMENIYIQMLSSASNNLSETIDHLNLVLSSHNADLEQWTELYIREVVNSTSSSVAQLAREAGVEIINAVPEHILIRCIPAYLGSIVLNMLTNAIKYRSPERESFVKVAAVEMGDKVMISFQDNGLGIDMAKHRNSLFGMYKTFHTHKESKGLGLFITKNQIEAMNGEIEVESELNKGTLFKIYLPYAHS